MSLATGQKLTLGIKLEGEKMEIVRYLFGVRNTTNLCQMEASVLTLGRPHMSQGPPVSLVSLRSYEKLSEAFLWDSRSLFAQYLSDYLMKSLLHPKLKPRWFRWSKSAMAGNGREF